ncbi:MAG: ribose 5-phosphate isomerase A [Rubrobacteraceae bacterium]
MPADVEALKRDAAHAAVDRFVASGMVVGLGAGTTASWVVRRIGEKLSSGELTDIKGIPTSEHTTALAREAAIPLGALSEVRPSITLDGADEVSSRLDVIKGRGGALLREKIVAASSENGLIIVADESKLVGALGNGPLPVETEPFVTDGGHYTIDCLFDGIPDPGPLEVEIKRIPGALECGLFIGLANAAVIARPDGVEVIER